MNLKPSKSPAISASTITISDAPNSMQPRPMSGLDEGQSNASIGRSTEFHSEVVKPQSINLMTLPRYKPPKWVAPIR